jgi:hypothetical protein
MMTSSYPFPQELITAFATGNAGLFIGAGLSTGAGLPGWDTLMQELVQEIEGCPERASYLDIAQYYALAYGRPRLVARLRRQLDTLTLAPTAGHAVVARLPVRLIFTTNYDDLLEQALDAAGRRYRLVMQDPALGDWPDDPGETVIVKLHGDLGRPDSIIITAEDYECYIRDHAALLRLLAGALQSHILLFLGYSATDLNVRQLLTTVRKAGDAPRRYGYTVVFNASRWEVADLEHRGLGVINLEVGADVPETEPEGQRRRNTALAAWLRQLHEQVESIQAHDPPAIPAPGGPAALADEVIYWLQVRGYTVVARQPQSSRAVDLVAHLPEGIPILVRCLPDTPTADDLAALDAARAARACALAWLITPGPETPPNDDSLPAVRAYTLPTFIRASTDTRAALPQ